MIRMEIACFLVVAFMAIMYFSAKREKNKLHNVFSCFLIVSMLHLILDATTIYTVNHLDNIPRWVNDVFHRLFIGSMLLLFFLIYRYILLLVEDESEQILQRSHRSKIVLVLAEICAFVLPIDYMRTEMGNYSYGPAANTTYGCIVLYVIFTVIALCRYWKQLHVKKKVAVCTALAVLISASVYQAFHPLALISGMGIMLIGLAFYLTLENPDIQLVNQVQEEKRKAEEANKAKSTFLSHVSHEIRTPMNAIVGMSDIMLRTELSEEQKGYLSNIKNSGHALISIINDILDISKIEAGKMELVEEVYELRPLLNDIRMMIENRIGKKPIKLFYEIDEEIPVFIYGDSLRIRQIIINLLNNAVKFTERGHVKLTVKLKSKVAEEMSLYVSVSDTGQGIHKEDLQRLFQAFEQADTRRNRGKEGTGLGLSISSQLISLMGGQLEVKSEYGRGSEFFFTIHQKTVSKDMEPVKEKTMQFIAPEAQILVVEDNEINRNVAVGLLEPLHIKIDLAENGKEALSMIQAKKYDLIFMDHMMPIMDGEVAIRRLRQTEDDYCQTVPVIAFTANAMKETEILLKNAGMNDFLAKPIEYETICKMICKWLPKELIQEVKDPAKEKDNHQQITTQTLKGINVAEGIRYSGSEELWKQMMGNFYTLIDAKTLKVQKYLEDGMLKDFTIEVHALKSSARVIGASGLSERFAELEKLGNAGEEKKIQEMLPDVLELYQSYKEVLKVYGTSQINKKEVSKEELILYLEGIQKAIENFDLDVADEAMQKLEESYLPESFQSCMERLRVYMADVDMEHILKVTREMLEKLQDLESLS